MKSRLPLCVAVAAFLSPTNAVRAEIRVTCENCLPIGENRSLNLLLRRDATESIRLTFSAPSDPSAGGQTLLLYAGNPVKQDAIPGRSIAFHEEAGIWTASSDFSPEELGRGTFLTVLTMRPGTERAKTDGSNETILDWRPFRLLTEGEDLKKRGLPAPGGSRSVEVVPALVRATTGHGDLPRHQGGDEQVWWSFTGLQGNTADLDLDGDYNGTPGLGVDVASPWHTAAGESWKDKVVEKLTGVPGHEVRFGELEWREAPDRPVDVGGQSPMYVRNYYTVITLYSAASCKTLSTAQVGNRVGLPLRLFMKPTYFSHETSARLKNSGDPRFWASYSVREYSADPKLLAMLRRHVEAGRQVPGLAGIQLDDGDGGDTTFTAGFFLFLRPWESPTSASHGGFKAGLVGLDVVAAHAGIGGVATSGTGVDSELQKIWCKVIRCGDASHRMDLDEPPPGYVVTQPVVSLGTLPGKLPVTKEELRISERDLPTAESEHELVPDATSFPITARFGVSAHFRAGALVQQGSFGYVKNVVPINVYAQFVVKIQVLMYPETKTLTSDEVHVPLPIHIGETVALPKRTGLRAWIEEHLLSAGVVFLVLVLTLVAIFVPGALPLLRKVLTLIFEGLGMAVDWMRDRIKRNDR